MVDAALESPTIGLSNVHLIVGVPLTAQVLWVHFEIFAIFEGFEANISKKCKPWAKFEAKNNFQNPG